MQPDRPGHALASLRAGGRWHAAQPKRVVVLGRPEYAVSRSRFYTGQPISSGATGGVSLAVEAHDVSVGIIDLGVAIAPEGVDRREVSVVSAIGEVRVELVDCLTGLELELERTGRLSGRRSPTLVVHPGNPLVAQRKVHATAEVDFDVITDPGRVGQRQ